MDLASGFSGSPTVSTRDTPQVLPVMLDSRMQNSGPSREYSVEIEDMDCVKKGCSSGGSALVPQILRVQGNSRWNTLAFEHNSSLLIINNAEAKIRFLDRGTSDLDSQTSSTVASWVAPRGAKSREEYQSLVRYQN